MTTKKRKQTEYYLVKVEGCVEPSVVSKASYTWKDFEKVIVEFLKKDGYGESDALFYIELTPKSIECESFSGGFMTKMQAEAGDEDAQKEWEEMKKKDPERAKP